MPVALECAKLRGGVFAPNIFILYRRRRLVVSITAYRHELTPVHFFVDQREWEARYE